MPWVHWHEVNAADVDRDLTRHLQTFHQAGNSLQDSASWHWHLVLLCQMVHGGQNSTDEGCPSPHLLIEDHCPCLNASPDLPCQLADQPCVGSPMVADLLAASEFLGRLGSQGPGESHHFLQTFLSKAPLCDLLSVIRC